MRFGLITKGGVVQIRPDEKPVDIMVAEDGVSFNNQRAAVNDSCNMQYDFETEAGRTLSVRYTGMRGEEPLWEFTARKDCGSIMCSKPIVGYKRFVYAQGTLTEKEAPEDLSQVA